MANAKAKAPKPWVPDTRIMRVRGRDENGERVIVEEIQAQWVKPKVVRCTAKYDEGSRSATRGALLSGKACERCEKCIAAQVQRVARGDAPKVAIARGPVEYEKGPVYRHPGAQSGQASHMADGTAVIGVKGRTIILGEPSAVAVPPRPRKGEVERAEEKPTVYKRTIGDVRPRDVSVVIFPHNPPPRRVSTDGDAFMRGEQSPGFQRSERATWERELGRVALRLYRGETVSELTIGVRREKVEVITLMRSEGLLDRVKLTEEGVEAALAYAEEES